MSADNWAGFLCESKLMVKQMFPRSGLAQGSYNFTEANCTWFSGLVSTWCGGAVSRPPKNWNMKVGTYVSFSPPGQQTHLWKYLFSLMKFCPRDSICIGKSVSVMGHTSLLLLQCLKGNVEGFIIFKNTWREEKNKKSPYFIFW